MSAAVVFHPPERELDKLASEITLLAGHLNAATYRFLMLIAEFDRRQGWADWETQSCAHWLNWKCGIAMGAAREKVRVARALESLPKISAAMERGELSYSKARELTRVACANTEKYLLSIAQHGTAQHVEKLVRHFRRAKEAEELSRDARQQAERSVRYRWDDNGSLILTASLPAEVGAIVLKALESALGQLPTGQDQSPEVPVVCESSSRGRTSNAKPSIAARRADALAMVAESFLAHGAEEMNGADKHQIVVHVSAETLKHGTAGCCEFEDGPDVPAGTSRRLACDASIVVLVEDENGTPLNVGRKTRTISAPMRRALNARDKGCRFPGCCNKRYIDGHHVQHWANGGETKLRNLVSLCRFHHRAVHEGGIEIQVLDDGAFRFMKPNGEAFDSIAPGFTQPLADWTELQNTNRNHGVEINPRTAVTRWSGESMDYGLGVQVLLQQAGRAGASGAA